MHLETLQRFSEERVRFITAQLVLALGYLHTKESVVYRDLKLENILMRENGYIVLLDFGISKQIDKRERTYSVKGTPEYMSPEMLKKSGYSFPVDWWALGTIVFELLFGIVPFYHDDENEMYKQIVKNKLDFPQGPEDEVSA